MRPNRFLLRTDLKLVATGINCRLRLAGSLDNKSYVQKINEKVKKNGLEQNVILLGKIDTKEIRQELSTASIFTLVSLVTVIATTLINSK